MDDPVLFVTGSTASGKSALAIALARLLDGEVISADSRQVYQGMDIGTAKPTAAERQGVPHHGFDLVSPAERYSAGRFARDARRWIVGIRDRGRTPIVAGGTGFFLGALTRPLFEEPELGHLERSRIRSVLAGKPVEELRRWVEALEPASTALDLEGRGGGGRQRLIRAIEVALLTGKPLRWWHRNAPARDPAVPAVTVVLCMPRAELYRRIDERVDAMVAAGWVDEVRRLLQRGFDEGAPGMTATGYSSMLAHVRGEIPLEEAIARTRRQTRQYARRQLTWMRNQLPADALRLPVGTLDAMVNAVERHWKERTS